MVTNEIYSFAKRVLGDYSQFVSFELEDFGTDADTFSYICKNGFLNIRGNTKSALTLGLGHYLIHVAKVNILWRDFPLSMREAFADCPLYQKSVEQKYRFYLNYCTFNYSASWWTFERWEREIDMMALYGINMTMCIVGVEAVWHETLLRFGFSDAEARSFLCGPAFLAWQLMSNIESSFGPLTNEYIEKRKVLGKKITDRIVSLGITPVQHGFSGYVPKLLKTKFPNAKIAIKPVWCGVSDTAQLDPTDDLFRKIGLEFLKVSKELFGAYGFYAVDPFHESEPPDNTPEYMSKVADSICSVLENFDGNYKWVMQAWSLRDEILLSAPKSRILVLDLNGEKYEKHEGFFGYDYVCGTLHNFGGRTRLHGDIPKAADNKYMLQKAKYANAVGTGLFMEGIEQNPLYYDLSFMLLTENIPVDLNKWSEDVLIRRYGRADESGRKALGILLNSVYAKGTDGVEKSSIICARPAVNVKKSGPNDGFEFPYAATELKKAIDLLESIKSDTCEYRYDLTDVRRQFLSDYAYTVYKKWRNAFIGGNYGDFRKYAAEFLDIFDRLDALLADTELLTLSKWIDDSEKWTETEEERKLFRYNAKALLTLWGNDDCPLIFDYSWREWSGLIKDFYKKRWIIFFDEINKITANGEAYSEEGLEQVYGREAFRANAVYDKIADFEVEWVHS